MDMLSKIPLKYRQWVWLGILFSVFLISMLLIAPWLQTNVIEPHQPYMIVDPDIPIIGCEYDYLNYMPVELTGKSPEDGVILPITSVPEEYAEYVHYPESWGAWNPFNPDGILGAWLSTGLVWITAFALIALIVYLMILNKQGKLKMILNKYFGSNK